MKKLNFIYLGGKNSLQGMGYHGHTPPSVTLIFSILTMIMPLLTKHTTSYLDSVGGHGDVCEGVGDGCDGAVSEHASEDGRCWATSGGVGDGCDGAVSEYASEAGRCWAASGGVGDGCDGAVSEHASEDGRCWAASGGVGDGCDGAVISRVFDDELVGVCGDWIGEGDVNVEENEVEQDVHDTEFLVAEAIQCFPSGSEVSLDLQLRDINEDRTVEEFMTVGCSCRKWSGKSCSLQFTQEHVKDTRLSCMELTRSELDLFIMGQLIACTNTSSIVTTDSRHQAQHRKRDHTNFLHQGRPICSAMFRFLHAIGTKKHSEGLESWWNCTTYTWEYQQTS